MRKVPEDQLDSKAVYDAATQGDKVALEIFEFTGKILGLALAKSNAISVLSPEPVNLVWSGLTKAGDLILKPTREHMEANLIQGFKAKVKLLVSHFKVN